MKTAYFLIDCNNFFVSCERAFNPKLGEIPVVVLSNNDGCVVSRSNEAKQIGIPMGVPYFKTKDLLKRHGGVALSSNFFLYQDMSTRVMNILKTFTDQVEIYSVDEAFLTVGYTSYAQVMALGEEIRTRILKWVGIPVSVGIATTKTLCKVAGNLAKKEPTGVVSFMGVSDAFCQSLLAQVPVGDVWGVGQRLSTRLNQVNIYSAKDLCTAQDSHVRKIMSVMGLKTVHELRGLARIRLEDAPPNRKSITCSRSFGTPVTTQQSLMEAIAFYISRAAERMRRHGLYTRGIYVSVRTNRFRNDPQYRGSDLRELAMATHDTRELLAVGRTLVATLFRDGFRYKKAGVTLFHLTDDPTQQPQLFTSHKTSLSSRLMPAMDALNKRFGRGMVSIASAGTLSQASKRQWMVKSNQRSQQYTTDINEILTVG